jgi:hypothetical protein
MSCPAVEDTLGYRLCRFCLKRGIYRIIWWFLVLAALRLDFGILASMYDDWNCLTASLHSISRFPEWITCMEKNNAAAAFTSI